MDHVSSYSPCILPPTRQLACWSDFVLGQFVHAAAISTHPRWQPGFDYQLATVGRSEPGPGEGEMQVQGENDPRFAPLAAGCPLGLCSPPLIHPRASCLSESSRVFVLQVKIPQERMLAWEEVGTRVANDRQLGSM